MRILILSALLATGVVHAEAFRNEDGNLELDTCKLAKSWRASGASAEKGDDWKVLDAALTCAKSGDRGEALALQAMADGLPRDDYLFGMDGNITRVRIALALGELDRAAKLLRTTSETLLDNWSKLDDPMSVMYVAHSMQRLNDDVAQEFRASDPARAVVHQLLAARAHDLPEMGVPSVAMRHRRLALDIALDSKLPAALLAASNAVLDRPAGELTVREGELITVAALELHDLKRTQDALSLARRLKATGQPDSVANADRVIDHIER